MNLSINVVKTAILGVVLFIAFSVAFVAQAAVTITSATINGGASATVAPGANVAINVSADKTGQACENNWGFTLVDVDGNEIQSSLNSYTGTGIVNDSINIVAPAVDGVYEVIVEVHNGVEPNLTCPPTIWDTETLSLTVETPVAPFINLLAITPTDVVRTVGDTNPVVFAAEVEIGGVPTSETLQCVVFDIFRGDSWNTVAFDFDVAGVYDEEDGIFFSYDISSYATGTYDVLAVALSGACDNLPEGFNTSDYLDSEAAIAKQTTLTIVEPVPLCEDENANNYGKEGECTYDEVALYQIFGYVWNDVDEDGSEITEPEDGENGLGGIIVTITNGEDEFTTETEEDGYYEFFVPAGTWTISDGDINDFEQTYPINDGNVHVVTVPGDLVIPVEDDSLLTAFLNWLIPTAHAQSAPGFGPYNFGNTEVNDDRSSSRSTATRVGDRDRSSSSDRDNDSSSDTPEGQVLGEATSVMPVGAPNTGHGGTAPVNTQLPALLAILGTNRIGKKTN